MAKKTIALPASFFKDYEHELKNFAHLVQQLDILSFQIGQLYKALERLSNDMIVE